ncbi:hypothetical protein BACCAP_00405 [Pseudoflavonifractor capillosus ATCC 29799]|uniref:Uncharacterized protein n=1 Tax=Pseudoflavonifractor capillosus ATCC 29799 TaxID=411467 RepID=A6NQD5_9FIRM|nr:hypothetical protein BACCAP_00405 [Pseudoflavonifractor capillosus ATCC 29799]
MRPPRRGKVENRANLSACCAGAEGSTPPPLKKALFSCVPSP